MAEQGKDLIRQIQEEVETQRGSNLWKGYCNLQKLVSGDIWESSTRFIYELLQNAEDAKASEFEVYLSRARIKVIHNGEPFNTDDISNICYAMSSKDPNETIGYLGVGFRSVFPITDKPEIHSGDYSFRFDRAECLRRFGDDSLYCFYPYWIEQTTEAIDPRKTTFILPFKSEGFFDESVAQLNELGAHSLLFLRNVRNLRIHNEEDNSTRNCSLICMEDFKPLPNNPDTKVGKFLSVEGNTVTRFLAFRRAFYVPEGIRNDEETQRAKRGNVEKREVSIAFKLDKEDNLEPTNGCICSFFPVQERRIRFLIHADFIVQAGRIALLENNWNEWMMQRASEVAETSYHYFQQNPDNQKWIEQSLSVFEKPEEPGYMYGDVLEGHLYEATKNPVVKSLEGELIPLSKAVKVTEETDELVKDGFVKSSDLQTILGEEHYLIGKDYPTGGRPVRRLEIDNLNSEAFLKAKMQEKGINFLIRFYEVYKKAMERRYSHQRRDEQERMIRSRLGDLLVADRQGNIKGQKDVWVEPDLKVFGTLRDKGFDVEHVLSGYVLIDKTLSKRAKGYLPEVNEITSDRLVKESILPRLKATSEPPSEEDILSWTYLLKSYDATPKEAIWVLDAQGQSRTSEEVFLSDDYNPLYRWQGLNLPNMKFLSDKYLELENEPNEWKQFFKETSMKGYSHVDYQNYVKDNILPILQEGTKAEALSNNKLIQYTQAMVECNFTPKEPIYVVTKHGTKVRSDSDLYFPSQYSPKENWENQNIIPLEFVSPEYIDQRGVNKWKELFREAGVREAASGEMIANFGKEVVVRELGRDGYHTEDYGGKADLQAKKGDEKLYIEVRSESSGDVSGISLDSERAKFSQQQGKSYCLANVINIPDAPYIYLLKDPANLNEVSSHMNIPKEAIEKHGEKIDARHLV